MLRLNIIKILLKLLVIIISWICLKIRKKTKSKNLEKLNTIANGIDDAYGKYKGAVTKKIYLVQIKMKIKILDKLTKSYNRHLKILRADMKIIIRIS